LRAVSGLARGREQDGVKRVIKVQEKHGLDSKTGRNATNRQREEKGRLAERPKILREGGAKPNEEPERRIE
jgi:hypothetical protein